MKYTIGLFLITFLFLQVSSAKAQTKEQEIFWQLTAISEYLQNTYNLNPSLSAANTSKIITGGTTWLINAQGADGHFAYEYLPFTDSYLDDDNIVRQAGALFVLSEIYKKQATKDEKLKSVIEKAISYQRSHTKKVNSKEGDFSCITRTLRSNDCDSGTVSLTLIGIVNYLTVEPQEKNNYEDLLNNYVSFLKKSRLENSGFSAKYILGEEFSTQESPFYNGEAMLALVKYYQLSPDPETKEILQETFSYLTSQEEFDTPLYLWLMAALKDMQKLWPHEEYTRYASAFTSARLDGLRLQHDTTHNYCAPLEGLTSAYSVLKKSESKRYLNNLNRELEFWLNKSVGLQINSRTPYRVIATDKKGLRLIKLDNPQKANGGFLTGQTKLTQRIDFTQHCLSAYLQKLTDIDGYKLK